MSGEEDEYIFEEEFPKGNIVSLKRGLADSAAGRVADLGDFTQYVTPAEINEEDLEINE